MFRSLVPKDLGLSRAETRAIEGAAGRRWFRSPTNLCLFGLFGVLVIGGLMAWSTLGPVRFSGSPQSSLIFEVVVMAGLGSAVAVSMTLISRFRLSRFVYAELRDRGHDVCPRCGYLRIGLDGAAPCPECGTLTATNVV